MTTDYVIPDVSPQTILIILEDDDETLVLDEGSSYRIELPTDQDYALRKRIALARALKAPPDDLPQGSSKSIVFLNKTQDPNNSWFTGSTVSLSHPEIVLEHIVSLLEARGIETTWYSEHDEYWDIADEG